MARQSTLFFYPERIAWIGATILGATLLLMVPFVFQSQGSLVSMHSHVDKEQTFAPVRFSLGLSEKGPHFPIPDFLNEMTFSFDPPRPDGVSAGERLMVRLKKSGDVKRIHLPSRIDLEIQKDKLLFSKEKSPFWVELASAQNGLIEGRGYINSVEEGKIDAGTFLATVQECPLQDAHEFAEGSPFRALAESRWWGRDQFCVHYETGSNPERVEVGSDLLELNEGDWLTWKDKVWQKSSSVEKDKPIARIQSVNGKSIVFEAWDLAGYTRISLGQAAAPPFKMRGEELFSAIRIRSEKQISCMLEKQCMVLKTGDWVLKLNGRWRILRKKEEREAFLKGKLFGEMFVFEQIHAKQGQKMIQGRLFNPGRTQAAFIEMAAQSTRKVGEKGTRRGKM